MEWLKQLNESLMYIERNLTGTIDIAQAAKLACCSPFHFQRMFSYMADVPLAEYVRRRRMTCAAQDLQSTDHKVLDIALRYGYDSPTAFNRAFQSVHGVPPSAARKEGITIKAYLPISFKISVKGVTEMNYRIETKPAIRIIGKKGEFKWSMEHQESFTEIPKFWTQQAQAGVIPTLLPHMNAEPMGLLGVSVAQYKDFTQSGTLDYYIAVASNDAVPEGIDVYEIPASTWGVFECKGPMPKAIQQMQQRIMTEWMPTSGYQYGDAADIEQYTEGDQSSEDYITYIWVPLKK